MKNKYFRKDFSLFIVDIMHFIALIGCWLAIWLAARLTLFSKRGLVLFTAVIIIGMLSTFRNIAKEIIEDKYLKNTERRHKKL